MASGPISCSIDDLTGSLGQHCAKYRLTLSSYYRRFEILDVEYLKDISQNGVGIKRVEFTCTANSDPESDELHESDVFIRSNGVWKLAHK